MTDEYWDIATYDAVGRKRPVRVIASGTGVVIRTPPGEAVIVPAASIEPLCEAMRAAHSVVEHRRKRSGRRPGR